MPPPGSGWWDRHRSIFPGGCICAPALERPENGGRASRGSARRSQDQVLVILLFTRSPAALAALGDSSPITAPPRAHASVCHCRQLSVVGELMIWLYCRTTLFSNPGGDSRCAGCALTVSPSSRAPAGAHVRSADAAGRCPTYARRRGHPDRAFPVPRRGDPCGLPPHPAGCCESHLHRRKSTSEPPSPFAIAPHVLGATKDRQWTTSRNNWPRDWRPAPAASAPPG